MPKYKKVCVPIEVPEGYYCWRYDGKERICMLFDNTGGHPHCEMNFFIQEKDKYGIRKAPECLELATIGDEYET